jgi:hypothetical protein
MAQLPVELVGRAAKDVPDKWRMPEGEFVASHAKKQNVMIVSRSCALDNPARKHVLVAPVIAVESLPPEQRGDEKLADLRENNIPHFFYLPAARGLAESYADLLLLTPIHRSFFPIDNMETRVAVRLSSRGIAAVQHAMSKHFGTQFGFDFEDICPQEGPYACSNCFHKGTPTQPRNFAADRAFGVCERCGEDAAWVKLP